jgi:ABC-type uncharacterized transport system substrate-binding protein
MQPQTTQFPPPNADLSYCRRDRWPWQEKKHPAGVLAVGAGGGFKSLRCEVPTISIGPKARTDALAVMSTPTFFGERRRLLDLAAKNRLPTAFAYREYLDAGGLIAYGPNVADLYRRTATYVDKILKGAKPADLPVEQPTKFEFVINLKTAKALGLTVPATPLALVDEVIE